MNIACIQTAAVWENKAASHVGVERLLDATDIAPGSLVILPEMFATGFSMNVAGIAEEGLIADRNVGVTGAGPTHRFLAQQAAERGVYMLGGVVGRTAEGRGRNQAVLFSPDGRELLRYQKLHPFSLGCEADKYEAGREIVTIDLGGFKVCPFICYDLRFPEIFREAVQRHGVNLFLVIAAWPRPRDAHWTTLLAARAIENQAYVAAVNHCGADPKVTYFGQSRIIDPKGQTLAEAGEEPAVIQATVDVGVVEKWRQDFPALRDIRGECGNQT